MTTAQRRRRLALLAAAVAIVGIGLIWGRSIRESTPLPFGSGPQPSFGPMARGTEVLVGAGDIASCDWEADEATARLLDVIDGTVFTTGDNVYTVGSLDRFERCYGPSWGRHRDRTLLPVAGNHEWDAPGAEGYLAYFGDAAAPDGVTWHATTLGSWRVIVLDTECEYVGGCGAGSAQVAWLREELARNASECTLALWHRPRFSSGSNGNSDRSAVFWEELQAAGAELVLTGHDHDYQRFAPQTADGALDPGGLRQFVAGTGGAPLRSFRTDQPNTEARSDVTYGVLRLELSEGAYAWDFVPVAGHTFADSGSDTCH